MCPESKIDLNKIAITGCSYAGKIALFSAAFDERITLCIAQEPGGGGDAAWRNTETLPGSREILRNAQGQHWYYQDFSKFNNAVTKLPYDHHELMAMIAPRALLILGNPDYEWFSEESGHVACIAAKEVWKALGVADRFAFSKVGGHLHCQLPINQFPEVSAFIDKFLLGIDSVKTNFEISPFNPDLSKWIKWTTPTLSDTLSSINQIDSVSQNIFVLQNYPNPFNSKSKISYKIPQDSSIKLKIYNLYGEEIQTLYEGFSNKGNHEIEFDGTESPSGIYFCHLKTDYFSTIIKLLLLK